MPISDSLCIKMRNISKLIMFLIFNIILNGCFLQFSFLKSSKYTELTNITRISGFLLGFAFGHLFFKLYEYLFFLANLAIYILYLFAIKYSINSYFNLINTFIIYLSFGYITLASAMYLVYNFEKKYYKIYFLVSSSIKPNCIFFGYNLFFFKFSFCRVPIYLFLLCLFNIYLLLRKVSKWLDAPPKKDHPTPRSKNILKIPFLIFMAFEIISLDTYEILVRNLNNMFFFQKNNFNIETPGVLHFLLTIILLTTFASGLKPSSIQNLFIIFNVLKLFSFFFVKHCLNFVFYQDHALGTILSLLIYILNTAIVSTFYINIVYSINICNIMLSTAFEYLFYLIILIKIAPPSLISAYLNAAISTPKIYNTPLVPILNRMIIIILSYISK